MDHAPREDGRSFRAFVGAQFLGAFNDNLFKQLVALLAAGTLFPGRDLQGLAFALFALPFVLFSGVAGDLSERYSKQRVIWWMKIAEVFIMAGSVVAFGVLSWPTMLVVLFVMGSQSAFFGPSKYGVIPELMPPGRLVRANSTVAMTTFLAALFGGAAAGPLLDAYGPHSAAPALWAPGAVCVGLALVGVGFAWRIAPLRPTRPELPIARNPFGSLWGTIRELRRDRGLFRVVILGSLFWFNSAVINQAINALGAPGYLNVPPDRKIEISALLSVISVGIIVGSLLVRFLARRVRLSTLVLAGGTGMVVCQTGLLLIGTVFTRDNGGLWVAGGLLTLAGVGGAVFYVPLQSYLQDGPPPGMRGKTFAVNNFMNFLCMFFGGVLWMFVADPLGPTVGQMVGGVLMLGWLWSQRRVVRLITIGGHA